MPPPAAISVADSICVCIVDCMLVQVGRDEDGKLGPGWFDVTDSELYPMEERLRTQVAVEALQVRGA